MILLLLACATTPADDTADAWCADKPAVEWDNFGHGFMTTYCTSCHSVNNTESRYGAPEGVDFDSEADVATQADRVRARTLDAGDMPLGGGVYEDDLYFLDIYLTCTLGMP